MKIHFLRNASLVIKSADHSILVDPMLAKAGSLPPFSFFRHKAKRNPLVDLPENAANSLVKVNVGLVSHCQRGHVDHLDQAGIRVLAGRHIPTYCRRGDAAFLRKRNIDARPLETGKRQRFLDGYIAPVPACHGHGWIAGIMGPGVGYFIELPDEPTLYIAGDTVMNEVVRKTLSERKPDIAIVAAGNASVDVGRPILMTLDEVLEFAECAPGCVVANHLEALNHCPISRAQLAVAVEDSGLSEKFIIPADGDIVDFGDKVT